MDCKDLHELLLAYAEDELSGTQRDFIEEHLNDCVKCRITLTEYKKARENLLSLRAIPDIPDMKEEIMDKIKHSNPVSGLRRMLRPALIAIPVVVIVAVILALQPFGSSDDTSGVIAKAYAATSQLNSFRYVKDDYNQDSPDEEPVHNFHAEIEYMVPEHYHLKSRSFTRATLPGLPDTQEIICIGDQVYSNMPAALKFEPEYFEDLILTEEKTLDYLNMLAEVETLEDEIIDGTECYRYIGKVDMDKYLEFYRPTLERMYYRMDKSLPLGMTTSLEDYIEGSNARSRTQDMTFEFWIGKDDYLLRKGRLIYHTREGEFSDWNKYKSIVVMQYSDFNKDITIEAPVDETGELLEGWYSYTSEPLEIPDEPDTPEITATAKTPDENEILPEELLNAAAVTEKLNSYKMMSTYYEHSDNRWNIKHTSFMKYGGYNLFYSLIEPTEEYMDIYRAMGVPFETILIGNQLYSKTPVALFETFGDINDSGPTGKETLKMLEMLFSVEILPDEEVNGTDCYHYRGILDVEKYLEWYRPVYIETRNRINEEKEEGEYKMDPESGWSGLKDVYRNKETIYEYWIGKEDHMIHKRVWTDRALEANTLPLDDLSHESTRQLITYYLDFNEPIEITAPLDEAGELLEGWSVVTIEE